MKYVFVGDIHGKVEKVEAALGQEGTKIFVGDFIDSFDRPQKDHRKCFELVLEAIQKNEAKAIFGNHELSYLQPQRHRCSGYSMANQQIMSFFHSQIEKHFKPFLLLEPHFLVSHAGLTKQLWESEKLTFDNLEDTLNRWWLDANAPMHWIGNYRGGINPVGGLFWCDWNAEFEPVPELTQVFGHTAGHSIRQKENSFCIDCLDHTNDFLTFEL